MPDLWRSLTGRPSEPDEGATARGEERHHRADLRPRAVSGVHAGSERAGGINAVNHTLKGSSGALRTCEPLSKRIAPPESASEVHDSKTESNTESPALPKALIAPPEAEAVPRITDRTTWSCASPHHEKLLHQGWMGPPADQGLKGAPSAAKMRSCHGRSGGEAGQRR